MRADPSGLGFAFFNALDQVYRSGSLAYVSQRTAPLAQDLADQFGWLGVERVECSRGSGRVWPEVLGCLPLEHPRGVLENHLCRCSRLEDCPGVVAFDHRVVLGEQLEVPVDLCWVAAPTGSQDHETRQGGSSLPRRPRHGRPAGLRVRRQVRQPLRKPVRRRSVILSLEAGVLRLLGPLDLLDSP